MTSEPDPTLRDATITASGIARLANVGRAAVSNWRRRYADFPTPVGGTTVSPSFNAHEVERWLRRQGKLHKARTEQWAWRHIESYQPAGKIGDALAIAGAYLLAHSVQPTASGRLATPKQISTKLRTVDRRLAAMLGSVLPDRWDAQLTALLRTVDTLAHEQEAEGAFEYLHNEYVTSAQSMSGLASTPDTVAALMLAVAGRGARVFDFTCGTGSILRLAADQSLRAGTATQIFGQEIKLQYALIAALRLGFVHQRNQRARRLVAPPVLHVGDSLLADAHKDLLAEVVVANFPFGIHDWGHDQLSYDPRWVYGLPPRTEPELAWLQHAMAHLSPGGTCVLLMPPAAATRPAGRRIRAELIRRGALRAVIALPAGLMPPVSVGLQIWVLTQPNEHQQHEGRLLLVDTTAASHHTLAELIQTAWRDYRSGRPAELTGVHRTVSAIELLDDRVDLTPQRYLSPTQQAVPDPQRTMAAIGDLARLLTQLRHGLPAVRPTSGAPVGTASHISVAELIRSDSMALLHPTRAVNHDASQVRPGDVIIVANARHVDARVASADQLPAELEPGAQVLRIDPDKFDSWFIAGVLSYTDNRHVAGRASRTSSSGTRLDVRHLTIPVMTLSDQQKYGRTYRQLAKFRTELERAKAVGDAVAREVGDGITSGLLDTR